MSEIRNPASPASTASTASTSEKWLISDEALARFHERAPGYDRDNAFFAEDFTELRETGYLRAPLPAEFGGAGLPLSQVVREQRRLAYWAPATALAVSMHLYWAGAATSAYFEGLTEVRWLLEAIAHGAVLAAGHGEAGNDAGLDDSLTSAVPQPGGGYVITGRKTFTSLSPVWTKLGVHARDDSDPQHPKIVHAFVDRDSPGVSTVPTWDALGVRATASDDTVLNSVTVPGGQVVAVQEVGTPYPPFVAGIFSWYLPLISNVYFGIARRALDVAIITSRARTSLALKGQAHARASWTANWPTPPVAPVIRTLLPRTAPPSRRARCAVSPATSRPSDLMTSPVSRPSIRCDVIDLPDEASADSGRPAQRHAAAGAAGHAG
jgi:alkylation response protein AidB-like acyl-CoA dehydrogenase